ncbi:MAG: hypothetical protein HOV82_10455 [Streptomyces sp.]|nr:hypothetical protein [Streptomyces sp.]
MNAKRVNAAAGVIHASQVKGKQTATGLAADLEAACMLQSPETAAEQVELRAMLEKRTELLRVVQATARRLRKEADGRKAFGDQLKAENAGLRDLNRKLVEQAREARAYVTAMRPDYQAAARLRRENDELRARVAELEAHEKRALPWAHAMPDDDLHGFLGDLVSAAMGRWQHSPEVPDREVLAAVEKACAQWRTPGQGYRSDEPETDGITLRFAPVAALREDPHESPLHHTYRLGRDLPQPDAAP